MSEKTQRLIFREKHDKLITNEDKKDANDSPNYKERWIVSNRSTEKSDWKLSNVNIRQNVKDFVEHFRIFILKTFISKRDTGKLIQIASQERSGFFSPSK